MLSQYCRSFALSDSHAQSTVFLGRGRCLCSDGMHRFSRTVSASAGRYLAQMTKRNFGIVLLSVGIGLLGGGIIAYLTGAMTIADVSRDCRVLGGPCPSGESDTLRTGQTEEFGGAASIVGGLMLSVLGAGIRVRPKQL